MSFKIWAELLFCLDLAIHKQMKNLFVLPYQSTDTDANYSGLLQVPNEKQNAYNFSLLNVFFCYSSSYFFMLYEHLHKPRVLIIKPNPHRGWKKKIHEIENKTECMHSENVLARRPWPQSTNAKQIFVGSGVSMFLSVQSTHSVCENYFLSFVGSNSTDFYLL